MNTPIMDESDQIAQLKAELKRRNTDCKNFMEEVRFLQTELGAANKACAEVRDWINKTVENCSVFCNPPILDCGRDYVPRSELDAAKAREARLREALKKAYDAACHFMVCRECAEAEPCIRGQQFTEWLATECEAALKDGNDLEHWLHRNPALKEGK